MSADAAVAPAAPSDAAGFAATASGASAGGADGGGTVAHRFSFRGGAGEYFRICIVNFLLIFITFGLYMPWAKIRTRRYLYGNTFLAGAGNFDYHANPWTILVSRLIIVFVVFGGAYWAGEKVLENFLYTTVVSVLLPWAIVRSLAFNARYTSFSGARLSFVKKYAPVYWIFLPYILTALFFPAYTLAAEIDPNQLDPDFILGLSAFLVLFTMLAAPWLTRAFHAFRAGNHRLGAGARFHFNNEAGIGDYINALWVVPAAALLIVTPVIIAPLVLLSFLFSAQAPAADADFPFSVMSIIVPAAALLIFVVVWALTFTRLLKAFWNRVEFSAGGYRGRFVADFSVIGFAVKIVTVNAVAIVLSLGLLYPWAKIRRTRYLAAHIYVLAPAEMLQNLPALAGAGESALGAELDSVEGFDFDIGLI